MRGASSTRDDHFEAPTDGSGRVFGNHGRSAMGRHDVGLMRDVELGEDDVGLAHALPVRLASHDDADQRARFRHGGYFTTKDTKDTKEKTGLPLCPWCPLW